MKKTNTKKPRTIVETLAYHGFTPDNRDAYCDKKNNMIIACRTGKNNLGQIISIDLESKDIILHEKNLSPIVYQRLVDQVKRFDKYLN